MILTLFADRRTTEVHLVARHLAGALAAVAHRDATHGTNVALVADAPLGAMTVGVAPVHPLPRDATGLVTCAYDLRERFAFVVIALEGALDERTMASFDASDRILVVTDLSVASLRASQRTLRLVAQLGYAVDKTNVILSRYRGDDAISSADAAAALKREIYWKLPVTGVPPDELAASYSGLARRITART